MGLLSPPAVTEVLLSYRGFIILFPVLGGYTLTPKQVEGSKELEKAQEDLGRVLGLMEAVHPAMS